MEAETKHDIHTEGCFAVTIPSNVTSISKAAFENSRQLVLLTIPESVTHIGGGAFYGCTSLASITLGESVTQIGDGAFQDCNSLASIILGESVTQIRGNTSLASILKLSRLKVPVVEHHKVVSKRKNQVRLRVGWSPL